MNEYQIMQDVWTNVNNLAALAATPGIDEETKEQINDNIRTLLKCLKPLYTKLSAASVGIVVT